MDSGFYRLSEDVMGNIFSRLPAPHFSSAACVSKTWNKVCGQILKTPKLASALSQEPDIYDAVNEVVDKVLAEPIIPHFAIACIGKHFSLPLTHQLLIGRLGSTVPLITNAASGIIGADTVTNELQDIMWDPIEDEEEDDDRGIVLMIGFVPGLKVEAIPLIRTHAGPGMCLVDNFLRDIQSFTAFYQDSESPTGIIMFGDRNLDMKPILARMDCALGEETVIVGDASGCFLCNNYYSDRYSIDAIAFVFARNRYKSPDIGETQFHVTLSPGIIPFGLELQAVCVMEKENGCSWLAARAEGHFQILDGEGLLRDIGREFDDVDPDLYIGVVQHRNYISPQGFLQGTTLAFYRVLGGERDFIIVNGIGINPGDPFLFYHSDSETALSSCTEAYNNLETIKEELKGNNSRREGKVIGGLIFSSYQRSDALNPSADISSFCKNFPEVPLAGVFCIGEIGRGSWGSISQENDEMNRARCCLHYYSTVYLTLSYAPPNPEH